MMRHVNRGSKVHAGQLLAKLERQDLAAAAQDNQGAFDQAQAAYTIATASTLPEEIQKAQGDTQSAKQALAAEQKLYGPRGSLQTGRSSAKRIRSGIGESHSGPKPI
jgi:multidrug efflux pump subunit AcrA (membrane-fusion protein)